MARLVKKIPGEIRGKIGNIVAKVRNGKYYIASAPSKYTISNKPHEVDKRNRFKVNGQFAKVIKGNRLLYRVWDIGKAPASNAFNKICKVNFHRCSPRRPSPENLITPGGFVLPVKNINSFPGGIEAELEPFNILEEENRITLILIVSFFGPESGGNYFETAGITDYRVEDYKFIFKFNAAEKKLAEAYKYKTVFLAAVTEDDKGNIVRWSETFGRDL